MSEIVATRPFWYNLNHELSREELLASWFINQNKPTCGIPWYAAEYVDTRYQKLLRSGWCTRRDVRVVGTAAAYISTPVNHQSRAPRERVASRHITFHRLPPLIVPKRNPPWWCLHCSSHIHILQTIIYEAHVYTWAITRSTWAYFTEFYYPSSTPFLKLKLVLLLELRVYRAMKFNHFYGNAAVPLFMYSIG